MRVEGEAAANDAEASSIDVFWVSSDYCRALDIPLKRGRWLTDRDGVDAPPAVLVSESFARLRFASADPVGRRIQVGPQRTRAPWSVIVGVVGDVRTDALDRAPREAVYQPHAMNPSHYVRLVARTSGDPARAERAVRAAIRSAVPGTAVFHVQPMDDYVASSLAERRFALTLIALFGLVALLLAAVGIGGVMSHSVVQRTPDRHPRGAGRGTSTVFAMILREGVALTAIGLALGLLIALGGVRLIASFLFGVGAVDRHLLMTAATLLAVAAVASACSSCRRPHQSTRRAPSVVERRSPPQANSNGGLRFRPWRSVELQSGFSRGIRRPAARRDSSIARHTDASQG